MKNPHTREEWQEAVDCAKAWMTFEAARTYGVISGGPGVDVERCEELLDRGASLGIFPSEGLIEEFVKQLKAQGAIVAS